MLGHSWQEDEQIVREYLEYLFGQNFSKQRLSVTMPGKPSRLQEFDAVSEDGKVVAQVKAYKSGQQAETETAYFEALELLFCAADKRLFFLTDHLFYQLMWRRKGKDLMELRKNGIDIISPWELLGFLRKNHTEQD